MTLGLSLVLAACTETTPTKPHSPSSSQTHTLLQGDSEESSEEQISFEDQEPAEARETPAPTQDIWQRIHQGYQLSDKLSPSAQRRVNQLIKRFKRHPKGILRQTENARLYIHYIVEELEKRNMPTELALLPLVESSYDPFAYSSGRASGLWQFIPSTGKHFGLKRNWWLDERRDVIASTEKALHYLSYLHKHFKGDWLLAIAAYNAGEGTVGKAMVFNRYQKKPLDYWSLPLPEETRFYIPKLLAWKALIDRPEAYGVSLADIPNEPQFAKLDAGSQIDLAKLAQMADMDIKQVYALNPAYNRWATDPDAPHELLLPIDRAEQVKQALAEQPQSQRVQWHRYHIQPKDSLSRIAQRFKTTTSAIKRINHLKSSRIRAGKTLLIPVASKEASFYDSSQEQRLAKKQNSYKKANKQRIDHTVSAGDTLWSIAKTYKVKPASIAKWNNMAAKDILRPSQQLVIWSELPAPAAGPNSASVIRKVIYRVKKGESLSLISNKFNVAVKDILQWNQLSKNKYIQPGQQLRLFVSMADQASRL